MRLPFDRNVFWMKRTVKTARIAGFLLLELYMVALAGSPRQC